MEDPWKDSREPPSWPKGWSTEILDHRTSAVWHIPVVVRAHPLEAPNGLEMSRPASSSILLDEPRPQLAGSAPSSCWAAGPVRGAISRTIAALCLL
jgi:hypothetical protein